MGDKLRSRSAEERCVDSWPESGEKGTWKRAHRTPRRTLFTPHRVANGPSRDIQLSKVRVTKGTYVGNGRKFEITDDYTETASAHFMLEHGWVGTTEFKVSALGLASESTRIVSWADESSDKEVEESIGYAGARTPVGSRRQRNNQSDCRERRRDELISGTRARDVQTSGERFQRGLTSGDGPRGDHSRGEPGTPRAGGL